MLERIDPFRLRMPKGGSRRIDATIYLSEGFEVEEEAVRQLADAAALDDEAFLFATPDIHCGYGVPIGSVFVSPHFVSPSAVGYDVNCGMRLLTTPLAAADVDIIKIADSIRRDIPLGEGKNNVSVSPENFRRLLEEGVPALAEITTKEEGLQRGYKESDVLDDIEAIEDRGSMPGKTSTLSNRAIGRGQNQLGSLGSGNHFIELQRVARIDDEALATAWGLFKGQLVVMIHSGSRGLGHEVGGHYMKRAAAYCMEHNLPMPSADLAYFPLDTKEAEDYLSAMNCAANFAFLNRQIMAHLIRRNFRHYQGEGMEMRTLYDVPHNIAKFEERNGRRYCIHRKGATRAFPPSLMSGTRFAQTGQPVLIPGSMGTASYLLAGIETGVESFYSVNHGAGRLMSRSAAAGIFKQGRYIRPPRISDEEFKRSMKDVHLICEDKHSIREEAPGAYKDIDGVIATVIGAGLAKSVARMTPLAVLKG